jgi:hypothetical protein
MPRKLTNAKKGKIMALSPTQRTLALMRKEGWIVAIVEKWVAIPSYPGGGKRIDVFGFGDLLAAKPGERPLLIQTTSGTNLSARRNKIFMIREARIWCNSGGAIELHGWRKTKPRGQKVARWSCRRERLEDCLMATSEFMPSPGIYERLPDREGGNDE